MSPHDGSRSTCMAWQCWELEQHSQVLDRIWWEARLFFPPPLLVPARCTRLILGTPLPRVKDAASPSRPPVAPPPPPTRPCVATPPPPPAAVTTPPPLHDVATSPPSRLVAPRRRLTRAVVRRTLPAAAPDHAAWSHRRTRRVACYELDGRAVTGSTIYACSNWTRASRRRSRSPPTLKWGERIHCTRRRLYTAQAEPRTAYVWSRYKSILGIVVKFSLALICLGCRSAILHQCPSYDPPPSPSRPPPSPWPPDAPIHRHHLSCVLLRGDDSPKKWLHPLRYPIDLRDPNGTNTERPGRLLTHLPLPLHAVHRNHGNGYCR
ncbi:hypothetical protein PVAP13_2NG305703 [Panicum virgatum]|uniref:Uncharacterized protein n=1 Tax=Panicum virgatum TaxID=38727 RepID=A0A8T0VQ72_PANVG|nr:hypothetical protein PVAP13_2NG305703 [Panicum virgatum]